MKKEDLLNNINKLGEVNESASLGSVLGDPGSATYGGFIGPLSMISKKKLNSRLFYTWGDKSVKNGSGTGSIVEPPQGYVKEHVYTNEGEMVTEGDLMKWFGDDLKQGPAYNGGKIVSIEPKCMAFPYCSQGAIDKPIKLIGESKEEMCEDCYGYCSHIGKETNKTPEYIAKLIREKYLEEAEDLGLAEEVDNQTESVIEKLDESIELKNNILENINKMENIQFTPETASKCMNGIMENKHLAECMYEMLIKEGFLPETINEGETYEGYCKSMMEDAEICMEMMKACSMNESDCGTKVNEGIKSFMNSGKITEEEGINPAIYEQLKYCIGKGHSYEVSKQHVADAVDGWDLSMEDYNEAKKMFGKEKKMTENEPAGESNGKYAKIKLSVENNGARKTGVKLIDMFIGRMLPGMGTSDLADTSTFANGLDTVEEYLVDGDYQSAVDTAKDTANEMLEDEGMGMDMFDEGPIEDNAKAAINEREERYMFFTNLEQMKREADMLLALDETKIQQLLDNGHDWAQDHIATAKESMDQVFDFIMNEMEGSKEEEPEMEEPEMEEPETEEPEMEIAEMFDVEDDTEVKSSSQQYDTELRQFNQFMNAVETNLGKVAKTLSNDSTKEMFNNYYRGFESSKEANADEFIDFIQKGTEENYIEYYDRLFSKGGNQSILMLLTSPVKRGFLDNSGLGNDDMLLDALDGVNELQPKVTKKRDFISDYNERKDKGVDTTDKEDDFSDEKEPSMSDLKNIEKMGDDFDFSDEDFLEEADLAKFEPIKGKFVDSENSTNSKKESKEGMEDAEDSQESTEEKVDNLKNQKFSPNMETPTNGETKELALGYKNALNLDYSTEPNKQYMDRVEMEVKTGHSVKRDKELGEEANIDNESEAGNKVWNASKENQANADYDWAPNPLVTTDQAYQKTSVSGKVKDGNRGNKVNEDLDKMKKMFNYDQKLINEDKQSKLVDENEVFLKHVSKKKML
jgi:predicted DNA-binding protein